jgi:hypothetical protein
MIDKVCDIEGCNDDAAGIITGENDNGFFRVAISSLYYRDYRSDDSLWKPFNLKDIPVQCRYN